MYSVDASDPSKANWMRYVKSAHNYDEQNMIATQYKKNIYYQTLRVRNKGKIVLGSGLGGFFLQSGYLNRDL